MANQPSIDLPEVWDINPHCMMYSLMHLSKTRFACRLSCFLSVQMTYIFKETSGIIPTGSGLNVDPQNTSVTAILRWNRPGTNTTQSSQFLAECLIWHIF